MIKTSQTLDHTAVAGSMLCLVHCLLLPFFVTSLPVLGVLAEAEWVHRALVLIVVPLSLIAFLPSRDIPYLSVMRVLAFAGVAFLIVGAFVEALHDYETVLTVIGAIMIGVAHSLRIYFRRHLLKVTA